MSEYKEDHWEWWEEGGLLEVKLQQTKSRLKELEEAIEKHKWSSRLLHYGLRDEELYKVLEEIGKVEG